MAAIQSILRSSLIVLGIQNFTPEEGGRRGGGGRGGGGGGGRGGGGGEGERGGGGWVDELVSVQ